MTIHATFSIWSEKRNGIDFLCKRFTRSSPVEELVIEVFEGTRRAGVAVRTKQGDIMFQGQLLRFSHDDVLLSLREFASRSAVVLPLEIERHNRRAKRDGQDNYTIPYGEKIAN